MTTVNEDTGRILWSTESKYYLLRLIKENMIILNPDVSAETMVKKEMAWKMIERNFVDDGMQCQLSKLKRLWKRMKDTARQNIIKYNDQKKRGIQSPKQPTDLDTEVADLIGIRPKKHVLLSFVNVVIFISFSKCVEVKAQTKEKLENEKQSYTESNA